MTDEDDLGGTCASAPAVVTWAVDRMEVFAIFPDGALWDRYWDGTAWHPWESLGGSLDPARVPAAASWGRIASSSSHAAGRRDLAPLVGWIALGGVERVPA